MKLPPVHIRTRAEAVPPGVLKVAKQRASDMMKFYGAFVDTVSLATLCESLYVQGCEDMAMAIISTDQLHPPPPPLDFQI